MLEQLDHNLLFFFNGTHSEWADSVMMTITGKWTWIPFYVILVGLMFWRCGWRRSIVYLLAIAAVITLTDQACASWIRPAVERLRPCSPDNPLSAMIQTVNGYCPGSYSFPSCHAANTFALASFLSLTFRNRGITLTMFAWATIVSISRLYLGVHYPSDLLAGALIGSAIATLIFLITSKIKFGKNAIAAICLIGTTFGANAQKFEWGGEFSTIFDNREGDGRHAAAETYFLTRLAPEIGISFSEGRHRVMGGAVWVQPIGCEWDNHRISPTLYYRYESNNIRGSLGMFPRTQLIRPLPEYLVSDSVDYFQHNLRGALFQTLGRNGFFEFIVDWRGMQSKTRREAFSIIAQGEWQKPQKMLLWGGTAMLNHLAKVKDAPANQFVVDNLVINAHIGVDFTPLLKNWRNWHSLSLRVGPLASLTRDRGNGDWLSAAGARCELDATFWRFTLRNVTWVGNKPLFPLYSKYGAQLNEGEPYYASKWYNRTQLSGLILKYKDIISLKGELDFHFADNDDFMFYQRIILTVKI